MPRGGIRHPVISILLFLLTIRDDELGEVDMLADGFRILETYGYWDKEQASIYTKMVAFRNMIAHQYADIGAHVVYDVLQHKLEDVENFNRQISDKL
ncbi:MAG: HepT-like ribonuclease domain-containing protein [Phycisphaerales bacterium]